MRVHARMKGFIQQTIHVIVNPFAKFPAIHVRTSFNFHLEPPPSDPTTF